MNWSTLIDGYCERLAPGLLAEPVNAITNLAFILAAVWLVGDYRRRDGQSRTDWGVLFLITMLTAIGIGSLAFHTFATRWAALADTLPIAIFIFAYTFLGMRRFFQAPIALAVLGPPALVGLAVGFAALGLGGASGYLPALIGLLAMAAYARFSGLVSLSKALLAVAAVFSLSLALRTMDMPLCAMMPLGTHWLWHVLNGLTLYLLVRLMMRTGSEA